jgi:predicted Zn-ribbon and HTH transcriptional regulator
MIEVADIFRQYGDDYRAKHKLSYAMTKAMHAIQYCRTSLMGGHVDECNDCGYTKISYNSCRNRHCPKCQNLPKERWVEARKRDLLPISYFHTVFTLPVELRAITLRNKKVMYSMLFKASSETLLELAHDPKYLGARIGFISLLHTWGQNLMDHPHVHCIVTGGGLTREQDQWVSSKKDFFIPVRVMSKLFRGKFLFYLKKARETKKLTYSGQIEPLLKECNFQKWMNSLYTKDWVVYCKPPFQNPEHVLSYLGQYTHKVAISNHRIQEVHEGKVSFQWKDYADNHQKKVMTLDALEFIRRFLLHIPPQRFVKIRHYGLLSNRNRDAVGKM